MRRSRATPIPTQTPTPAQTPSPRSADPAGSASPGSPAVPLKRSDPAEARARRQRLLAKAMQNMGVGPFNRAPEARPPTPVPGSAGRAPGGAAIDPADAALRRALREIAPRASEGSFFARLGLPETAGRDEVKAAFLSLARQFHPDLFAGPAMADLQDTVRDFFTAVNEAYEVLSDDKRRAEHLAALRSGGTTNPQRAESARIDFQKGEACMRTRDFARARGFLESAMRADPRPEYQAALAWAYVVDRRRQGPGPRPHHHRRRAGHHGQRPGPLRGRHGGARGGERRARRSGSSAPPWRPTRATPTPCGSCGWWRGGGARGAGSRGARRAASPS